jgi:hypothetical protein
MKVTYIYVKQSPLGLLYLGKTEQNPFLYKGSGKAWKKHLTDNNIDRGKIKTFILHKTIDRRDLELICRIYSDLFNVAKSDKWANMKKEIGDGGTDKGHLKGVKKPNHSKRMSGSGNPRYGKPFSIQTINKMKEVKKNKRLGSFSPHAVKVDQYSLGGQFIKRWNSIIEAERYLGVSHQHISKVCKGIRNQTGGYKWMYIN